MANKSFNLESSPAHLGSGASKLGASLWTIFLKSFRFLFLFNFPLFLLFEAESFFSDSSTLNLDPLNSKPFNFWINKLALSSLLVVAKPNPLHSLVSLSRTALNLIESETDFKSVSNSFGLNPVSYTHLTLPTIA